MEGKALQAQRGGLRFVPAFTLDPSNLPEVRSLLSSTSCWWSVARFPLTSSCLSLPMASSGTSCFFLELPRVRCVPLAIFRESRVFIAVAELRTTSQSHRILMLLQWSRQMCISPFFSRGLPSVVTIKRKFGYDNFCVGLDTMPAMSPGSAVFVACHFVCIQHEHVALLPKLLPEEHLSSSVRRSLLSGSLGTARNYAQHCRCIGRVRPLFCSERDSLIIEKEAEDLRERSRLTVWRHGKGCAGQLSPKAHGYLAKVSRAIAGYTLGFVCRLFSVFQTCLCWPSSFIFRATKSRFR